MSTDRTRVIACAASSPSDGNGNGNNSASSSQSQSSEALSLNDFKVVDNIRDEARALALQAATLNQSPELRALPEEFQSSLARLVDPESKTPVDDLALSAKALRAWRDALRHGKIPGNSAANASANQWAQSAARVGGAEAAAASLAGPAAAWPREPFRGTLVQALNEVGMARFTRKHPNLADSLLRNILDVYTQFELERRMNENEEFEPEPDTPREGPSQGGSNDADGAGESDAGTDENARDDSPGGNEGGGAAEADASDAEGSNDDVDFDMDSSEGAQTENPREAMAKKRAEELIDQLKEQWEPVAESLEAAEDALGNDVEIDWEDLVTEKGFDDNSRGLWRHTGWAEMASLREKLEELRELRDLIRTLGRGSNVTGELRRSLRQVERSRMPDGVVRSSSEPREMRGLEQSDAISRMLPTEYMLLSERAPQPASKQRFHLRRLEHELSCYELSGWTNLPAATSEDKTEVRPTADGGPIIVCLDTSGSMSGAREAVAKCVVLQCIRTARANNRRCYLYAFSGPGQCEELELSSSAPVQVARRRRASRRGGSGGVPAMNREQLKSLLDFLSRGFNGGTDVDEPLRRSLQRLRGGDGDGASTASSVDWSLADILLVTDGEIPNVSKELLTDIEDVKTELGVKVHGVVVGGRAPEGDGKRELLGSGRGRRLRSGKTGTPLDLFCTDTHALRMNM